MSTYQLHFKIVSPSTQILKRYTEVLSASAFAASVERLQEYPSAEAIDRMLRLNAVDLMVIDCQDLDAAIATIRRIRSQSTEVEILAVCEEAVRPLSELMRAGVRGYVPPGAEEGAVAEALRNSIEALRSRPAKERSGGGIVAFLPGKPGSGASTIAAQTALAASQSKGKRTLLVEMDFEAPLQAFLHQLRPEHYVQDLLTGPREMDSDIWSRLVSTRENLHILPAACDGIHVESGRVRDMLEFARRAYDLTIVDLPGSLDPYSVEVLSEAKSAYLVCTQELSSVHVAMKKAERLRRIGFERDLRLILNRHSSEHVMTDERLAGLAQLPVEIVIPNGFDATNQAIEKGERVAPASPVGRAYKKLAEKLLDERLTVQKQDRKFLEFLFQPFARPNRTAA